MLLYYCSVGVSIIMLTGVSTIMLTVLVTRLISIQYTPVEHRELKHVAWQRFELSEYFLIYE